MKIYVENFFNLSFFSTVIATRNLNIEKCFHEILIVEFTVLILFFIFLTLKVDLLLQLYTINSVLIMIFFMTEFSEKNYCATPRNKPHDFFFCE